jgi:hypothetical protein
VGSRAGRRLAEKSGPARASALPERKESPSQ